MASRIGEWEAEHPQRHQAGQAARNADQAAPVEQKMSQAELGDKLGVSFQQSRSTKRASTGRRLALGPDRSILEVP